MNFQKQTLRPLFFLFLLMCLLSGLVGVVRVPVEAAPQLIYPANSVIISEFRFRGPNGATDEFIELYNPTNVSIDISGWLIRASNNIGTTGTRATIPALTTLQSGQHYLITNNNAGGPYSGSVLGNLNYGTGIADDGGVALTLPDTTTIIDQVGMTNCLGCYFELNPQASLGTNNLDRGYERRIGGANGSCQDDANNLTDFTLITPSDPQNFSSPSVPCGVPTVTPSPTPPNVVINEVAWAGTVASSDDEWIELYNAGGTDIDISGWRLVAQDGAPDIIFPPGTNITAGSYFLLERARDEVTSIPFDYIYTGALDDTGEILRLRMPNGTIVDTANSNGGSWPAGSRLSPFPSMERTVLTPDSDFTWVTFDSSFSPFVATDASGNNIYGTPGFANSQPGVTPTFTPTPTLTFTPTATATFTATTTPTRTLTPTITSTALTPATNIVISEFRTIGPSGGNDEFIELYNPTALPVSIGSWMIRRSSSCGSTIATIVTIPATVTLASGQHYLIGGTTYSGSVIPDQTNVNLSIGDTGGLALFRADGVTIVDQVGLCASTSYREGTAITAVVANANQSWDRKSSLTGLCVDSNNNVQDFILRRPSDPQNFASPLTRCGNPTPTPTITQPPTTGPKPTRTRTPQPTALPPPPPLIAINEFVPRPGHDWNNDGVIDVGDEYIELINHGVIDVNLSGYSLDDEANIGSNPYRLPAITLKPGERMVFYGKDTGLLLSDGGDGVRLNKPNGQLGDAYNYTVVKFPDQSYCRLPDNGGDLDDFTQNCFPTPGLKNSLSGSFVRPPTQQDEDPPACPISDILPNDFAWAECPSFGNIWSRFYWDAKGWFGEMALPDIDSKWDVYVD